MCNLITEGTKYGCGHYIIERKTGKIDCNNPYCTFSVRHRNPCVNCTCERVRGAIIRVLLALTPSVSVLRAGR
ncbi:hypothetical protein AcV5_007067 [Taiwanofungus camphoratus]|nr:hypothetical protein AcV5_007067 [Antrodia cinnamomea]